MYLNSFYFGMFATCEIGENKLVNPKSIINRFSTKFKKGMATLKFVNLPYTNEAMVKESIVILALCLLESIRIHLGRKGSLSDHGETF